jgi:hypothetical protein
MNPWDRQESCGRIVLHPVRKVAYWFVRKRTVPETSLVKMYYFVIALLAGIG